MPAIKKKDFVEVEYTGKIKEDNIVFDTTDSEIAKKNNIFAAKMQYGPVIVCIGEGQILKGLEDGLEGKETGKEYTIELKAENAFGKKDARLIKMIPAGAFRKQAIDPQPGLEVNIDGVLGIIRRCGGGRCLVDFNHPLAGKDLIYKIKVNKLVADDKEKVKSYLKLALGSKTEAEFKESTVDVKTEKEIPKEVKESISKKLAEIIPSVKKVNFVIKESK